MDGPDGVRAETQSVGAMIERDRRRLVLDADRAAAAVGGKGFTLSPDQAEAALREIKGFLDELQNMKASASQFLRLRPPAEDPASTHYNRRLTRGTAASAFTTGGAALDAAVTQIDSEIHYLETLRAKLGKALGTTVAEESESVKEMERAGRTPGGMAG